jgi:hypothetical protein
MGMEPEQSAAAPPNEPIPKFPGTHVPVIFADRVSSASWSATVIKFYFARSNPTADGTTGVAEDVAAQVVMPLESFAATAAFFDATVRVLIDEKKLAAEQFESLRAVFEAQRLARSS